MSGLAIKRNLEGKPSIFWSYPDKKSSYLKIKFGITDLLDRLILMMQITGLLETYLK